MLSRCKHIFHFLLVAMVMGFASCTSWREAKAVIAEADRLLGEEKIITRDTVALNFAIETLNGPLGYLFAKQELAKAYYFMGRNFYYLNDFSTAADYYILCDRLNPTDPLYKGRINSCMGFICKQDSCFEEACKFYERSSRAFKEAGNDWYYAHNLLNIAEQYVNLKEYNKADSILQIANNYDIDSAYYARIMDIQALSCFNQKQYDLALMYLLTVKNYPRPIEARCYSYMKIIQIYARQDKYQMATKYANYIILNTTNPNYKTNAYYVLLKEAEFGNNLKKLAEYSYLRKDEDRKIHDNAECYAQASSKLKSYILNPNPYGVINLCFAGAIILFLILVVFAYIIYKRHQSVSRKNEEMVYSQEEQRIAKRKLFERKIFDHSVYFLQPNIWKDTNKLREQANIYCGNIFYRLEETYHFSEQEMKICLMVLLEFPREQMANYLYVQPNTISKAKGKIAKILGTTSSDLRNFLIDFLAS